MKNQEFWQINFLRSFKKESSFQDLIIKIFIYQIIDFLQSRDRNL